MESPELQKSIAHITVEIIEYVPNAVVIKTILKKSTGNISVMSFDVGEGLTEKISPFDTFAQIIEGKAEIIKIQFSAHRRIDHHPGACISSYQARWTF